MKKNPLFLILIFALFLLTSLNLNSESPPVSVQAQPQSNNSSTVSSLIQDLNLIVLYQNGSYFEDVNWEDIQWSQVDKAGIKRSDIGRAGFESEYGSVLWYPLDFSTPVMYVYQRFWGKRSSQPWDKFYITQDVCKTPFMRARHNIIF